LQKNLHDEASNRWKEQKHFTEEQFEEMAADVLQIDRRVDLEDEDQGKLNVATKAVSFDYSIIKI
jgi:uncharacterized protein involved in exopolysaccharide biosynthesis